VRSIAPVPKKAGEDHLPSQVIVKIVIEQRNVRGCIEKGFIT